MQSYNSNKENKILPLSLTVILNFYGECFPNFFTVALPASNIYVDIMKKNFFSGIELAILDNFLQYQEYNGTQTKWWNSNKDENSLFTSLLRLASSPNSNTAVASKISQLINTLTISTVVFNKLLASPITALINSLQMVSTGQENKQLLKIWKLLDQTIAFSVKTPYKYVDMAQKFGTISPFMVALLQQWKFVSNEDGEGTALVVKFICIFFRNMSMIGESQAGILSAALEFIGEEQNEILELYLNFSTYESKIQELRSNEKWLLSSHMDSSFAQYITLAPYKQLKKITRYPVGEYDVVATIFRLKLLLNDDSINFDSEFKLVADALISKVTNYVAVDEKFSLLDPRIFQEFFAEIDSTSDEDCLKKYTLVTKSFIHISQSLERNKDEFENFAFQWLKQQNNVEEHSDLVAVVSNSVNADHAIELLKESIPFNQDTVSVLLLKIQGDATKHLDFCILEKVLNKASDEIISLIITLLYSNRIDDMDSSSFTSMLVKEERFLQLLLTFMNSSYFSIGVILPFLSELQDSSLATSIAIGTYKYIDQEPKVKNFVTSVISRCYSEFFKLEGPRFDACLDLFCMASDKITDIQKKSILQFITTEYKHKYGPSVIKFILVVNDFENATVDKWLSKMTLYITKFLSEDMELSGKYLQVLSEFRELVTKIDVWTKVNRNILNSQLEVILSGKLISDVNVLEYLMALTLGGNTKLIQSDKMVQLLLNNENNLLNMTISKKIANASYKAYLTVTSLYWFFNMDVSKNSTTLIQQQLLTYYNGSVSCQDRLILKMLETIESKTSISWTNYIYNWDFLESTEEESSDFVTETKLITKEKEGLIITLRKEYVQNSIVNYPLERPSLPNLQMRSVKEKYALVQKFYHDTMRSIKTEYVYDPLFVMLLTLHNKELVSYSSEDDGTIKYKFEIQKFLSSKFFQLIVVSLADCSKEVSKVAIAVLTEMLYSLEDNTQFKEGHIFQILLKKIIVSWNKNEKIIQPVVWSTISRICDLLLQPASPLYEKAFRWVLNGPAIRPNDIPLMQDLIAPRDSEVNYESYYKQLSWVLESLEFGIKSEMDLDLLKRRDVFEWLFNLINLPYLNSRMKSVINRIFYNVQRIENGGSALLTRYGAVSTSEVQNLWIKENGREVEAALERNSKNSKHLKRKLLLEEQNINTNELLEGYVAIISSQKRLREWVEDDGDHIMKRTCQ